MPTPQTATHPTPEPHYRSGAVARMVGMPVSTLRIWEQRYQAIGPHTSATGQRHYSGADVARVRLLRQLTEQGHAIGSLAGLSSAQLHRMAPANPHNPHDPHNPASHHAPPRLVVVGRALARRLQRPSVLACWPQPPQQVAVFDTLAQAAAASAQTPPNANAPPAIDLLVWQTPGLQSHALPELQAAQHTWQPHTLAVVYRFANAPARAALAHSGAQLAHEPTDDAALGHWLASLTPSPSGPTPSPAETPAPPQTPRAPQNPAASTNPWLPAALGISGSTAPARRFDDARLSEWAHQTPRTACECPSHVAELLLQMTAFEAYSADCTHRNPADAALHADLHRIAGAARVLLETALERVAVAEGWALD
jgi:MerR family transcriptional regulator, light-induced transcriptional regulator